MALEQVGYDRLLVKEVIDIYERIYPEGPDSIVASMLDAKREQEELRRTHVISKTGVVNKNDAGRRQRFTMPSNLYIMLKKKFPTIFKEDIKKFERDFPVFFKSWK